MRITYSCPSCGSIASVEGVESAPVIACPRCEATVAVPSGAVELPEAGGEPRLLRCLVCPCTELFTRKDFPQRVGVGIVVAGFAASCITWAWRLLVPTFAILFGTALVDVVLYLLMPDCQTCYRCGARYRGAEGWPGAFDLETHEKHRQQKIRLAERAVAGRPPASTS